MAGAGRGGSGRAGPGATAQPRLGAPRAGVGSAGCFAYRFRHGLGTSSLPTSGLVGTGGDSAWLWVSLLDLRLESSQLPSPFTGCGNGGKYACNPVVPVAGNVSSVL